MLTIGYIYPMTTISAEERNSVITSLLTGGATRCPLCLGVGYINNIDRLNDLFHPQYSICPICKSYRNESKCRAWIRLKNPYMTDRWVFIEDDACEEMARIIHALESVAHKIANRF